MKYRRWMPTVARSLCRLGATNPEIAEALRVSLRTLDTWRRKYPEFAHAVQGGKALADARVTAALYQRAIGHKTSIRRVTGKGEIVEVDVYEPPEIAAIVFWLCNRRKDLWRHVSHIEHTGADGGPIEVSDARQKLEDEVAAVIAEAERATED